MDRIAVLFVLFVATSHTSRATPVHEASLRMEHINTIQRLVRRVRWRIKLQQVMHYLARSGYVTVCLAAIFVILYKTLLIEADVLWWGIGACVGINVIAALVGAFKRISDVDAAAMLDAQGGTHSRLGTALSFLHEKERTPLMDLAIEDAAQAVTLVKPKMAAPMALPAALVLAAVASFFVTGGAVYYHFSVDTIDSDSLARLEVPRDPPHFSKPPLGADLKSRLAEEQKELEDRLKKVQDPRVKQMLAKLNKLIRDLQEGKLTLKEAFKRMAELDKLKAQWKKEQGEGLKDVAKKVKKAADSLKRPNKALKPMLEAIKKNDLKQAAREMEKLAKKMEKGEIKKRDQKSIRKDMQKLADALKTERQKRAEKARKERDRLKKKKDRLAQKKKKDRLNKRDRDRLKKRERQLEQLRREREQMSEARRQLERLQRQMDQNSAANQQRRQQGGSQQKMTAQQMRKAAEMMRRMAQQGKNGKTMRVAEGKVIDLKELMRRAGQQQGQGQQGGKNGQGSKMDRFIRIAKGQQGQGQKGQQDQNGQGKDGQGKDGQGGKPGQGQGQGGKIFKLGKNGEMVMLGGKGGQPTGMKGKGKGMGQGQGMGEGAGDGHDGRVMGRATNLSARYKESSVKGREANGQNQSRVVMAAARKGFATRQYRKVHQDYSKVVEETLDRQEIPAGQRRYVRRYFDLIRPR